MDEIKTYNLVTFVFAVVWTFGYIRDRISVKSDEFVNQQKTA